MPPTRHTSMVMAVDSAYGYGYGRMATGMAMASPMAMTRNLRVRRRVKAYESEARLG